MKLPIRNLQMQIPYDIYSNKEALSFHMEAAINSVVPSDKIVAGILVQRVNESEIRVTFDLQDKPVDLGWGKGLYGEWEKMMDHRQKYIKIKATEKFGKNPSYWMDGDGLLKYIGD